MIPLVPDAVHLLRERQSLSSNSIHGSFPPKLGPATFNHRITGTLDFSLALEFLASGCMICDEASVVGRHALEPRCL